MNCFYAECIGGMCVTEPSAIHEHLCQAVICLKEQRRGDAILLYVNATDFFIMIRDLYSYDFDRIWRYKWFGISIRNLKI